MHSSKEEISYLGIWLSIAMGVALYVLYKGYYQYLFQNDPLWKGPFSKKNMKLEKREIFYRISLTAIYQLGISPENFYILSLSSFLCGYLCYEIMFRISLYDGNLKQYRLSVLIFQFFMLVMICIQGLDMEILVLNWVVQVVVSMIFTFLALCHIRSQENVTQFQSMAREQNKLMLLQLMI